MSAEHTEEYRARWRLTLDLFEQALDVAPGQRQAWLDSSCPTDPLLRRTLDEMLAAHEEAEAEEYLEAPVWSYTPPDAHPQKLIGHTVGAYRLKQFVASGGMGLVYLAERADKFFQRDVAVKLIRADLDPKQYRRFRREVQILADLKHPNLVMLFDAGRLGDGRPFLVMEYVAGRTLLDWLKQQGPMPPAMITEVLKQACAGLQAAHDAGIIHRDIKPGNIMLSEQQRLTVKVLDFGIAARKDTADSDQSSTQGVIGTLLYMSPEQLRGASREELTPASDVYALGLVAYELLTGRPAINGVSQAEIIYKHLHRMPEPPSRSNAHLPAGFDDVVLRSLAKDAQGRYQSAQEFARAWEAAHRNAAVLEKGTPQENNAQRGKDAQAPANVPAQTPLPASPSGPQPLVSAASATTSTEIQIRYPKPALAVAALVLIAFVVYLAWPSAPLPAPNNSLSALPSASAPVAGFRLNLAIERPAGQAFADCQFVLFKPEVTASPTTITAEAALVFLTEVNAQGTSKIVKEEPVPPGNYLISLSCPGFRPVSERMQIRENPKKPGWALVPLKLTQQ